MGKQFFRGVLLAGLACALPTASAAGAATDPAYAPLEKAYEQLRRRDYDAAIASFRQAIAAAPARAAIRKDLAYTLLKTGEPEAARDEFAEAWRLDSADHHAGLEYAFLCYETRRQRQARLVFDRIRKGGDAAARATAGQAFENIDRPLEEGIARWTRALEADRANFSAHHELATLAEQRNALELAAAHYEQAWRLKPQQRSLLVDLGRVWKELGLEAKSRAALLAASRGAEPRAAEEARELLSPRYPYVYEFRQALELDPGNVELRRELAYLLLEMNRKEEAEQEFRKITGEAPGDALSAAQLGFLLLNRNDATGAMPLLERVLKSADEELADRVRSALRLPRTLRRRPDTQRRQVSEEARLLAESSYRAGYLKDALKYLTVVHETDPVDFSVMLKLGWTYNMLHQDEQAVRWFNLARRSPDAAVAAEAQRAWDNLRPQFGRLRTTVWLLPFYSSRWRDLFSYGQIKTEIRLGRMPLRPYLSMRFVGDTRQTIGQVNPQYLSESSFIFGVGVATAARGGLMGWAEAGSAVSYLGGRREVTRATPDYRGGVSFAKGFGRLLGGESAGAFFETHEDGVFVSRFRNSILLYTQNRFGYTFAPAPGLGGLRVQIGWNANATADLKRQYWANFVETGPGVRFRWPRMPAALVFAVDALRGAHTINLGNPRRPNYFDVRAGFWYAFTR